MYTFKVLQKLLKEW